MNKETIEQYAQVLLVAASVIDVLNKRKNNEEIAGVAKELRRISAELVDHSTEVKESVNYFKSLISFIKKLFNK